MADWSSIADTAVDPDAPVTSELAYAWRDNPIAIAEGAINAPRVQPKALASNVIGAASATGSSPVIVFTGIYGIRAFSVSMQAANASTSTANNIQIGFSTNGGGSWSSYYDVFSTQDEADFSIDAYFDIQSGSSIFRRGLIAGTGTFTPSGISVDALRFRLTGAGGGGAIAAILCAEGGRLNV